MTASRPCDADGFPFRLPNTNVPCVWKLVAILAEQAHVVHSIRMKVLLRFTLSQMILFRHAHNGLLERQLVVPGLPLIFQAGVEI